MNGSDPLHVIDALTLPAEFRTLLRPGEEAADRAGCIHILPRFFYEVPSWEDAKKRQITPHFTFAELLTVDCRESDILLNTFPHYVPCAVTILAQYLERFREKVDAPVFIAVNGGYRSPAHRHSLPAVSPHAWACAANIYRIGDAFLDDEKTIEKYRRVAESIGLEVSTKPFGHGPHEAGDHLHLDIGYATHVPAPCSERH